MDSYRVLGWITEVRNQSGGSSSERVWKAGDWASRRAEDIEFEVPLRTGKGDLVAESQSNVLTGQYLGQN